MESLSWFLSTEIEHDFLDSSFLLYVQCSGRSLRTVDQKFTFPVLFSSCQKQDFPEQKLICTGHSGERKLFRFH